VEKQTTNYSLGDPHYPKGVRFVTGRCAEYHSRRGTELDLTHRTKKSRCKPSGVGAHQRAQGCGLHAVADVRVISNIESQCDHRSKNTRRPHPLADGLSHTQAL
jgi:hypothetical protein